MADSVDSLKIEIQASAKKASTEIDDMISKLGTLKTSLSSIDGKKATSFSSSFASAYKSMKETNSASQKLKSGIDGIVNTFKTARTHSISLSNSLVGLFAGFKTISRGAKEFSKSMEKGMDYVETYNYYSVTMDKIGSEFGKNFEQYGYDSAEAYADSFSGRLNELTTKMSGYAVGDDGTLTKTTGKNLSLDPEQLMSYQANISAVTNSLGLAGETSINTSKALTMLASDMSSFKNVELSTVMTNFQSGLIGQSRALYKYGIDITNATLQTYAYKNGVEKSVSEMTQAEKMQLRLLAILDQSKVAWGDQANTISSVANQYRIMKQQVSNLARIIGNLLLPIVQKALPVINGMMIALQSVLEVLGVKIFGDNWLSGIMDGISSGYSGDDSLEGIDEDAQDTADSLADANEKAKKFKNTLLGFDEMNVLNDNSDDSDTSSGIGSSGKSPEIDLSGAIADAVADYESVWNKALQNSQNKAQEWADKIGKVFKNLQQLIGDGEWGRLGAYVAGGINKIVDAVDERFNWDYLGGKVTKAVDGFTKTINSLVKYVDFKKIGKTLGDGLNVVTNTMYLWNTGIDWIQIGEKISDGANGLVNSIDWNMLGRAIGSKFMKLPKIIAGFVGKFNFGGIGKSFAKGLNGIVDEIDLGLIGTTIGKTITGAFDFSINFAKNFNWKDLGSNIANGINGVLKNFDGKKFAKAINGFLNGILTTMETVIKEVDWGEVVGGIGDFIGNLDWWAVGKATMMIGIGKFALNSVSALTKVFNDKMKTFNIIDAVKNISSSMAILKSGGLTEGTGMISKLADAFALAKGTGYKLSECLALEFPKITGFVTSPIGALGLSAGAFTGLILAIDGAVKSAQEANFAEAFQRIIDGTSSATHSLSDYSDSMKATADKVTADVDTMGAKFTELRDNRSKVDEINTSIGTIATAMQSSQTLTSGEIETLKGKFDSLKDTLGNAVGASYDYVIQQMYLDMQYLQSQGKLSDEQKQYYADSIADMYAQKQAAQDESSTVVQTLQDKLTEYQNSCEVYGTSSEQARQAQKNLSDAILQSADVQAKYGVEQDKVSGIVDIASQAISDYSGTLNLSKENITDYTGVSSTVNDTLTNMTDTYNQAVTDVKSTSDEYVKELQSLKDSGAITNSQMEEQLSSHNSVVDSKLTELKGTYSTNLENIQADLVQLVPGAMTEMGKQWDNMNFIQRMFCGYDTKEAYINGESTKFINKMFGGDSEMASSLQACYDLLGVSGGVWAGESAKDMLNDFFDVVTTNSYEGVQLTETTFKGQWKGIFDNTDEFVKKALENYDWDDYAAKKSKEYVTGCSDGITNNKHLVTGALGTMIGDVNSTLSSGLGNTYGTGQNAMQNLANGMNSVRIPVPHFGVSNTPFSSGGVNFTLPSIGVSYYAKGGMPNTGELFMARENGINEMVGRMGNQSAVANNDQITQGISDAVAPSVYEAVVSALRTMGGVGGNNGDVVVQIDGKEVFRAVKKVNNNEVMSTGQPQFLT